MHAVVPWEDPENRQMCTRHVSDSEVSCQGPESFVSVVVFWIEIESKTSEKMPQKKYTIYYSLRPVILVLK